VRLIHPKNLDLVLPISLITLGELLLFSGHITAAVIVNGLNLLLSIYLSGVYYKSRTNLALMLVPLFRLINLATPIKSTYALYSYLWVYGLMLIPIYLIARSGRFSPAEIGLTTKGIRAYFPVAIAIGFVLGWTESRILYKEVIVQDLGFVGILEVSLVMVLLVGVVEEFIFRSAVQTVLEERLGSIRGLLVASILFGIMYSNYGMLAEILFGSCAGLVLGALFQRTKNLPLIALAHGTANIVMFFGSAGLLSSFQHINPAVAAILKII
jgi:membrane protease YdiL (CAAX protease family)